jgi:hypothetical protein
MGNAMNDMFENQVAVAPGSIPGETARTRQTQLNQIWRDTFSFLYRKTRITNNHQAYV